MSLSDQLTEATARADLVASFQALLRRAATDERANMEAYQKLLSLYDMGYGMKPSGLRKTVRNSGADEKVVRSYLRAIDDLEKPRRKPSMRDVYGGDRKKRPWGLGT